jgi:hypothetical protein
MRRILFIAAAIVLVAAIVWAVAFFIVVPYFAMALDYGNVQLIVTALMFAGLSLAIRRRDL